MKNIAILGSTGSIGTQTLDVVRNNQDMKVVALTANNSVSLLEQQIREFSPAVAVLLEEEAARDLRARVSDTETKILSGMEGLMEAASLPEADIVVTAFVGMIGIQPTIAAIRAGKDIALANKETLVTAGHLIMPLAAEHGVRILPIDSEHNAIFQCLEKEGGKSVERLIITASGGPFRGMSKEELCAVTLQDALVHPTWKMGKKITIDSATLVNKGMEIIEARWLFNVSLDKIEVVVQPQSIVHSLVSFTDGSLFAQLSHPDIRLPIQYALAYPERRAFPSRRLDLAELGSIQFERPDTEVFRGLPLATRAAKIGGSMPTVYNAANEAAVEKFLQGAIRFPDIYEIIETAMNNHQAVSNPDLETILAVERDTRAMIGEAW